MAGPGRNPQLAENLNFRCCRTEIEVYRCGHSAEFPVQCHREIGPNDLFAFHMVTHRLRTDVDRVCDNCLGDYCTMEYQHETSGPLLPPAGPGYPKFPVPGTQYQNAPFAGLAPGPGPHYPNASFAGQTFGRGTHYQNPYLSGGAHNPNAPLAGHAPGSGLHYPNPGLSSVAHHSIAPVTAAAARQPDAPAARAASANAPEPTAQSPDEGRQTVRATVESDDSSLSTPPESSPEREMAPNPDPYDGRRTWRKVRADMRDVKMQKELAERPIRRRRGRGD